jgi:hypothetical protein
MRIHVEDFRDLLADAGVRDKPRSLPSCDGPDGFAIGERCR